MKEGEEGMQSILCPGQMVITGHTSALLVPPNASSQACPAEEPMQLGRAHLTQEEGHQRLDTGVCLYCGEHSRLLATLSWRLKRLRSSVNLGLLMRHIHSAIVAQSQFQLEASLV